MLLFELPHPLFALFKLVFVFQPCCCEGLEGKLLLLLILPQLLPLLLLLILFPQPLLLFPLPHELLLLFDPHELLALLLLLPPLYYTYTYSLPAGFDLYINVTYYF